MIELYHADGTRSLRVLWVLEELGLKYTLKTMKFPPRINNPEYLDISPSGSLPALVDGSVTMTESMAICVYLDQTYGYGSLSVRPEEDGYADYLQHCFYGEASLASPVGSMTFYKIIAPEAKRLPQAVDDARLTFSHRLEPVRRALVKGPFMAAGRFTLADVSVAYALGLAKRIGEADAMPAEVKDYAARLATRPAYRRAYLGPPAP